MSTDPTPQKKKKNAINGSQNIPTLITVTNLNMRAALCIVHLQGSASGATFFKPKLDLCYLNDLLLCSVGTGEQVNTQCSYPLFSPLGNIRTVLIAANLAYIVIFHTWMCSGKFSKCYVLFLHFTRYINSTCPGQH